MREEKGFKRENKKPNKEEKRFKNIDKRGMKVTVQNSG
jgi:hypothetical protein